MKSDVYCFKCKEPLDVIEEDLYDNEEEKDYLEERELSKGVCSKCGSVSYFTVEWLFTITIPNKEENKDGN